MAILRFLRYWGSRIGIRLMAVMLLVALVPFLGIELAQTVEEQLLTSLERDMRNQVVLLARSLEPVPAAAWERAADWEGSLRRAARKTRTRLRVVDRDGTLRFDSHRDGPPEGPEPRAPTMGLRQGYGVSTDPTLAALWQRVTSGFGLFSTRRSWDGGGDRWPPLRDRREVRDAFEGKPSSRTRIRDHHPEVLLFVSEPVRGPSGVEAAVVATRSTEPVLFELYRIRKGLLRVLLLSFVVAGFLTVILNWSISSPLATIARAARRLTVLRRGQLKGNEVPLVGSGEVRELAEALRAMTGRLQDRANATADFAADVAHAFKSPLTAIRGAAELLSDGAAEDPEARTRFLRNILEDGERLDRLVSDLLRLSRLEAAEQPSEVLDLQDLVREAHKRREGLARLPDGITDDGARTVLGDRTELMTALENLLDNAERHTPDDTVVSLGLREGTPGFVELVVRDQGPGVAAEQAKQVFDRFFTTDPDRSGTGLGLAIVKAIAERHGGDAWIRSRLPDSVGTEAVVRIPRHG